MSEFRVDPLTRMEGLGRLIIYKDDKTIKKVRLEIFEPPRFFEAILRGKRMDQVLDIVARVCGLCPVAYQMSALEAFENILNLQVPEHIRKLRRVIYCGEWISSHSAHIFFMHLPDFFNKNSFIELAKERKDLINMGLKLRKTGNLILETLGGRHVHPVNLRVGGFYRLPSERNLEDLLKRIEEAIPTAEEALDLILDLSYPEFEISCELISLGGSGVYPFMEGKVVSSGGWEIEKEGYEDRFEEYQLPHSTALYSRIKGNGFYLVGAVARFNNNFHLLPEAVKEKVNREFPIRNPFKSIVARTAELLFSLIEAKRILESVELREPCVEWEPVEGESVGITEAPRGILYHRYRVNREGIVEFAKIVPPTSQNQGIMEEIVLKGLRELGAEDVQTLGERLIRTFDPCISCASHFIEISELPYTEDGFYP